jgi:hypothetical protein
MQYNSGFTTCLWNNYWNLKIVCQKQNFAWTFQKVMYFLLQILQFENSNFETYNIFTNNESSVKDAKVLWW